VFALLAGGALAAACLDPTPITVTFAFDASVDVVLPNYDDVSPEAPASDGDPRPLCERCIETPDDAGPGCGDELKACFGDPTCKAIYTCIIENGCLVNPSRQEVTNCGLSCAVDAGLATPSDPSAVLIIDVAKCALSACAGPCNAAAGTSD